MDKATIDKIKEQEANRTDVPTLDELLERIRLAASFTPNVYKIYSEIASGERLFNPAAPNLQILAAQTMCILIKHVRDNPPNKDNSKQPTDISP